MLRSNWYHSLHLGRLLLLKRIMYSINLMLRSLLEIENSEISLSSWYIIGTYVTCELSSINIHIILFLLHEHPTYLDSSNVLLCQTKWRYVTCKLYLTNFHIIPFYCVNMITNHLIYLDFSNVFFYVKLNIGRAWLNYVVIRIVRTVKRNT